MDTDRNLLFAVLALQADLIDRERFVQACTLWAARKNTPIAELLIEQGWLTLIGDLNWLYEKHAAEADVRLLPGVFGVTNAIAIKQGSEASELRALGMATRGPARSPRRRASAKADAASSILPSSA